MGRRRFRAPDHTCVISRPETPCRGCAFVAGQEAERAAQKAAEDAEAVRQSGEWDRCFCGHPRRAHRLRFDGVKIQCEGCRADQPFVACSCNGFVLDIPTPISMVESMGKDEGCEDEKVDEETYEERCQWERDLLAQEALRREVGEAEVDEED